MSSSTGRIRQAFERARAEGRAALVAYLTAGYPEPDGALDVLVSLVDAGADVLELGVPFSDPLADGPIIQRSSFAAIERGVDLAWTLELLRRFRALRDAPVVLFSYLNPILDFGTESFLSTALSAGADGVLLTDLPLGADPLLEERFERSELDLVRLVAPTTTPERAREIAARSQGFIYYISRTGVTGIGRELSDTLTREVEALRAVADLPVAVGFGIARPEQAALVAESADGVVVGSAIVDALGRGGEEEAARLVQSLRGGIETAAGARG